MDKKTVDKKIIDIKVNWKNKKSIIIYILLMYFLFIVYTYSKQYSFQEIRNDSIVFIIPLWIIISLIYMIEIAAVRAFFKNHLWWMKGLLLVLSPMVSFGMVEIMVSNFNMEMFKSYSLFNVIWYYIIYFLIYAIIRNSKITIILSNYLIYIAAMVNYLVFTFRGNPILPSDLLAWKTGMSVASNYELSFTKDFVIATLIMLLLFVVANKLEKKKTSVKLSSRNRFVGLCIYLLFAMEVFTLFFGTNLIKSKIKVLDFFAPKYTYCSYGTVFGFIANVDALLTECPEGYSVNQVESAFDNVEEDAVDVASPPNIIAIMNEAFSDLSMLGDYETNMEYLPYTKTLSENTIKGNLYVSVFGGATSDTEYEFLTGNSMAVMPKNCVPYQQFITQKTDSLVSTLKTQGYYNIAIHPYEKSGYKRDIVYPLFGFDEFLSMDDFENPELIRSYISDRESYKKIIEQYETKGDNNPLFIFNVTMQNHGGYTEDKVVEEEDCVQLTGMPGYPKVEQYLSLVRQSDKAFQILTDYFSKQEEPTIILIFGDHQPVIYSDFHDAMMSAAGDDNFDVYQKKYMVPFIIWANYDIPEADIEKMSANYLSSYLLKIAGVRGTEYNKYLMELYEKLPVINGLFYIDEENQGYQIEEPSEYFFFIKEYQFIGYNNALDKKNRLDQLFGLEQ